MRLRHKAPSTFSLWMVDVICCSLGSVIFIWIFTDQKLVSTAAEKGSLQDELDRSQKEEDVQRKLAALRGSDLERTLELRVYDLARGCVSDLRPMCGDPARCMLMS